VSYDPPQITRPQQKVYDLMMTKPKFGNNHMSQVHWMPYENMEDERNQKSKLPSKKEEFQKKQSETNYNLGVKSMKPSSHYRTSEALNFSKSINNRSS
jgi:hypothetical protein